MSRHGAPGARSRAQLADAAVAIQRQGAEARKQASGMPATGSATTSRWTAVRDASGVALAAGALAWLSWAVERALNDGALPWLGNGLLLALALRAPRAARWWL